MPEQEKTIKVPTAPIRKDILIKAILKAVRGIVINRLKPNFDYSLSYKDLKVYMRKATFLQQLIDACRVHAASYAECGNTDRLALLLVTIVLCSPIRLPRRKGFREENQWISKYAKKVHVLLHRFNAPRFDEMTNLEEFSFILGHYLDKRNMVYEELRKYHSVEELLLFEETMDFMTELHRGPCSTQRSHEEEVPEMKRPVTSLGSTQPLHATNVREADNTCY